VGDRRGAIILGLRAKLVLAAAIVSSTIFSAVGCNSLTHRKARRSKNAAYETVSAAPNRLPLMAQSLTNDAIDLICKCDWCPAQELLRQALAADVSYGPAHNALGKVYYAQHKYYLAAWEFEYAIMSMPERAEPYNNLGLVYEAVGRTEEAIEQYQSAYNMNPQDPNAIGNLARTLLRQDPDDEVAMELLRELTYYDTRPNWVYWASERLGLSRGEHRIEDEELPQSESLHLESGYMPESDYYLLEGEYFSPESDYHEPVGDYYVPESDYYRQEPDYDFPGPDNYTPEPGYRASEVEYPRLEPANVPPEPITIAPDWVEVDDVHINTTEFLDVSPSSSNSRTITRLPRESG